MDISSLNDERQTPLQDDGYTFTDVGTYYNGEPNMMTVMSWSVISS